LSKPVETHPHVPAEQAVNRWTTLLEESQEGATSCVNLLSETLPH